jgi:hypothetical protein
MYPSGQSYNPYAGNGPSHYDEIARQNAINGALTGIGGPTPQSTTNQNVAAAPPPTGATPPPQQPQHQPPIGQDGVGGNAPSPPPSGGGTAADQAQGGYSYQGRNSWAAPQIQLYYRTYLGREATPQEVQARLNDPNFNLQTHMQAIQRSQEAGAYTARVQQHGVPGAQQPPASQPAQQGAPTQQSIQSILSKYGYGPEGLKQAEAELLALGVKLQKDSNGQIRGRLLMPDGGAVDVLDQNEGHNWWTSKTGSNWGWRTWAPGTHSGPPPSGGAQGAAVQGALSGGDGWMSRNTQEGGDALQVIYRLLGPLMNGEASSQALMEALIGVTGRTNVTRTPRQPRG